MDPGQWHLPLGRDRQGVGAAKQCADAVAGDLCLAY